MSEMIKKTLGGERLGSGAGMKVAMHNYERSTFDLSRVWRSTATPGVLIPCFGEYGLPGDTFDIDLSAFARTVPTQGALFGAYKIEVQVFKQAVRCFNGLLHNNCLAVGMNMAQIKMPLIKLWQRYKADYMDRLPTPQKWANTSLPSFMNLRGLGYLYQDPNEGEYGDIYTAYNKYNAIPFLMYYEVYKNYFANKQEEEGVVISGQTVELNWRYMQPVSMQYSSGVDDMTKTGSWKTLDATTVNEVSTFSPTQLRAGYENTYFKIKFSTDYGIDEVLNTITQLKETTTDKYNVMLIQQRWTSSNEEDTYTYKSTKCFIDETCRQLNKQEKNPLEFWVGTRLTSDSSGESPIYVTCTFNDTTIIKLHQNQYLPRRFDLSNIDEMRKQIFRATGDANAFEIYATQQATTPGDMYPYKTLTHYDSEGMPNEFEFNGLCLKTYQSDMFNNWLSTTWVENINNISKVSIVNGAFSIDQLQLAKKVYDMMNRVAVSGGSYEDWQEAIYGEEAVRRSETPIYCGGAHGTIEFDEVISQSATDEQPLGTIAGRGDLKSFKNGHVVIKCDEPEFIMAIVAITPIIDYNQNEAWYHQEIKTMDDFHKPGLDGIGFQDLLSYKACYENQLLESDGQGGFTHTTDAIGKQPAWLDYQTAVNELHGQFCEDGDNGLGWMVLKRDYQSDEHPYGNHVAGTYDFTTYIDPRKYNYVFADTALDAQNFWLQLGFRVEARRKMSAKVMPNL